MRLKFFTAVSFLIISLAIQAQQSDAEFAEHYFKEQQYRKAILYLDKLYDDTPSQNYFDKLLTSLIKTEAYSDAEKLIKKHFRGVRNDYSESVALAKLYQESNPAKADEEFKSLSKLTLSNQAEVNTVVEFLINSKQYQYAYDFYSRHKSFQSTYNYYLTIARIYGALGDRQAMIDQYLNMVLENPSYINIVKSSLLRYLDFVEDKELSEALRISLLKAQQKSSYSPAIVELLQWYYLQINAFEAAYDQLKAASKRNGVVLESFLELAKTMANNGKLDLCYEVYSFLAKEKLSEETKIFIEANKVKYAYAYYNSQSGYGTVELPIAEVFDAYISQYPLDGTNAFVYLDYADYLFKYKSKQDSALQLCEKIINTVNIYPRIAAFAKIKKADILVANDDVWEASLLYSQVEKSFKNDDLGSHAKLKNAQIAYYTGDFEWAQAQLDVIKAATSELISNNAIDLSLIITDNLNLDTSGTAMTLYAKADLLLLQNKNAEAIVLLDSLASLFPTHSLRDEVLWKKYQIAKSQRNFELAKSHLEQIEKDFGFDIYGDDAIYNLGILQEEVFKSEAKAIEYYTKLLTDYPNSVFTADARKRLRILRGDVIRFEG